ncbi:hypothetical protein [Streptomyces lanatus]|uniref:Uncharacterized protein n=1 Tax=Streptomyces lanatus TaxID=66900 RepID=A0ABV1Y3R4_9ACTN|nr:hypothetical protein [Streptomyces lanatus]GHH27294.1 hypothetical protein GCM10018780_82160 [Streptomyces lanatus]
MIYKFGPNEQCLRRCRAVVPVRSHQAAPGVHNRAEVLIHEAVEPPAIGPGCRLTGGSGEGPADVHEMPKKAAAKKTTAKKQPSKKTSGRRPRTA